MKSTAAAESKSPSKCENIPFVELESPSLKEHSITAIRQEEHSNAAATAAALATTAATPIVTAIYPSYSMRFEPINRESNSKLRNSIPSLKNSLEKSFFSSENNLKLMDAKNYNGLFSFCSFDFRESIFKKISENFGILGFFAKKILILSFKCD